MMALWLVAGGMVGLMNSFSRWWTVARLRSDMERSALFVTLGGLALRLALITALLIGGLMRGIVPGLLAFGGLWVTRLATVVWIQAGGAIWSPVSPDGDRDRPPQPQMD